MHFFKTNFSGQVVFHNVKFQQKAKVRFREVDLGEASFHGTNLEGIDFLNCELPTEDEEKE